MTSYYDESLPPSLYRGSTPKPPATPSKGAAKPGDTFAAEATVTASDAPNAAKLAGLGYVAAPTTAWTTGQKITVGTFEFSWSGTAWQAGAGKAAPAVTQPAVTQPTTGGTAPAAAPPADEPAGDEPADESAGDEPAGEPEETA